jgi:hypothetical protein
MFGDTLIDTHDEEWLVIAYQGDTYRVVNVSCHYLSEAEGKTLPELVEDLEKREGIQVSYYKRLWVNFK